MFSQLDVTAELVLNGKEIKEHMIQRDKIKFLVYKIMKRGADILFSLVGCLLLIPISLLVKIITLCSLDFHSIFYCQNRIGKNGKEFKLYKFRSMVPNADEVLKELLKDPKYKEEWDLNQKFEHDPRITSMGNILRKTSLDELPQFINILIGDMSLIGPRPLVPGELDSHNGNHELYESVRPGISGWWAANGRSATTYERRLELEYYYVQHCGLILDIRCVFRTIKAVIYKTGAK